MVGRGGSCDHTRRCRLLRNARSEARYCDRCRDATLSLQIRSDDHACRERIRSSPCAVAAGRDLAQGGAVSCSRSGAHCRGGHRRTLTSRSEEHTSELQSLMRISYAVFCLKKKKYNLTIHTTNVTHQTTQRTKPHA